MRLTCLLSLAITAMPLLAEAQDLSAAHAFVAALYDRYGHGDPEYLGRDGPSVFDPSLLRLIRRDQTRAGPGYVGALDWDPICGCQDADGLKLVGVNTLSAGPTKAQATAKLSFPSGGPIAIRLDLIRVGGAWRVSDIHERETPSLVHLLNRSGQKR